MNHAKKALEFQDLIRNAVLDEEWSRYTVEAMRESGLVREDARAALALLIYLTTLQTLYYFPIVGFDRLDQDYAPTAPKMLTDVLPDEEAMIIFESDIIVKDGDEVAYCALAWRKRVMSIVLADRTQEAETTAMFFVFRLPFSDAPQSFFMSPLLIAHDEGSELVVTTAYNHRAHPWRDSASTFLNRVGLVCEFMRQKIADTSTYNRRKSSLERGKRVSHVSSVKIVTLRAIEHSDQPSASEHRSVDWSCRWTVREHDRKLRDGRVIKVREHKKGPEGKPERVYGATIFDVSR